MRHGKVKPTHLMVRQLTRAQDSPLPPFPEGFEEFRDGGKAALRGRHDAFGDPAGRVTIHESAEALETL